MFLLDLESNFTEIPFFGMMFNFIDIEFSTTGQLISIISRNS